MVFGKGSIDTILREEEWDIPQTFTKIGEIKEDKIRELTSGLFSESIDVVINRAIFEYDLIVILGPVLPHEVVGFSGGNKYFFPGISVGEFLHLFHWLGALITCVEIIGKKHTPTRRIIDRAAAFIKKEKLCISMVVKSNNKLAGLFVGTPEESWSAAADLSSQGHIVYRHHPYDLVLGTVPSMYTDRALVCGKGDV